jgi:hypothetical protein
VKCMCGDFLIPDVMHRVDGPCYVISADQKDGMSADPRRWNLVVAAPDSMFIWDGDIEYARALAHHVGRDDLRIVAKTEFNADAHRSFMRKLLRNSHD